MDAYCADDNDINQRIYLQIVESNSDVELVDRWYVRLLSLFCVPLYGLLKIYDLYRFIKDTFLTALGGLVNFIIFFVSTTLFILLFVEL